MNRLLIVLCLCLLGFSPASEAREPLTDHALVSPYEGSVLRRKDVIEFDEYNAFTGMDEAGKEPTGMALEGKITNLFYNNAKDRSILEMFRRAQAVVAELVANYGISRDRLNAHGVGPLSPQATNTSDTGRARNRRVVLVAR